MMHLIVMWGIAEFAALSVTVQKLSHELIMMHKVFVLRPLSMQV